MLVAIRRDAHGYGQVPSGMTAASDSCQRLRASRVCCGRHEPYELVGTMNPLLQRVQFVITFYPGGGIEEGSW